MHRPIFHREETKRSFSEKSTRLLLLRSVVYIAAAMTPVIGGLTAVAENGEDSANLLRNGGFEKFEMKEGEKQPRFWEITKKGQVSADAHSDEYCVKLPKKGRFNKLHQAVELDPGSTYVLSLWSRVSENSKGARPHTWVQFKGLGGWRYPMRTRSLSRWTMVERSLTVPEKADGRTRIVLANEQKKGAVYFDDVKLIPQRLATKRRVADLRRKARRFQEQASSAGDMSETVQKNVNEILNTLDARPPAEHSERELVRLSEKLAFTKGLLRMPELHSSASQAEKEAGFTAKLTSSMLKLRPRLDKRFMQAGGYNRIEAARQERESVHVAVTALQEDVTVQADVQGFPSLNASVSEIRHVLAVDPEGTHAPERFDAGWVPDPVIPLGEGENLSLKIARPALLRCTFDIPEDAAAGVHHGAIRLYASDSTRAVTLPLAIRVRDFKLPDTPELKTQFGSRPGALRRYYQIRKPGRWFWPGIDNVENTRENIVEDEQSADGDRHLRMWPKDRKHVGYGPIYLEPDTRYKLRFSYKTAEGVEGWAKAGLWGWAKSGEYLSAIDESKLRIKGSSSTWREVEQTFNSGQMFRANVKITSNYEKPVYIDNVRLTSLDSGIKLIDGGSFEHNGIRGTKQKRYSAELKDIYEKYFSFFARRGVTLTPYDIGFRRRIRSFYFKYNTCLIPTPGKSGIQGFKDFVSDKSLQGRDIVRYLADEPHHSEYPEVAKRGRAYSEAFPEARLLVTEPPVKELSDVVDIWVPHYGFNDQKKIDALRERNDELWLYTAGKPVSPNVFINNRGVESRIIGWGLWKTGATGFLYATVDPWSIKCGWKTPEDWERARKWLEKGWKLPEKGLYGAGWLVYPGPDGPYSSLRLELLCDGFEDYGYFAKLRGLYAEMKDDIPAELEKEASQLLNIPGEIMETPGEFTQNGQRLLEQRAEIARVIEKLKRAGN